MEGWICPVCKRGVAPSEKHCDHGSGLTMPLPALPTVAEPARWPGQRPVCETCKRGGVCGCYLPQYDSPWCYSATTTGVAQ